MARYDRKYVEPNMKDYEEEFKKFKLDIPEEYNFGFDVIDRWAEDRTKLALLSVEPNGENPRYHTFWHLKVMSNKFANVLRELGLKKGDRVFIMLPRIPEWYFAMLGMFKLGVIPMPATVLATSRDIDYRANRAEACAVITDLDNAPKAKEAKDKLPTVKHYISVGGKFEDWLCFEEAMEKASRYLDRSSVEPTKRDETMLLFFSSGTVKYPKMVLHPHSYAVAHTVTARYAQDLKPTDLHWTLSDTGWAKCAWGKLFGQWIVGATVFQHNAKGAFNADLTLRTIEKYGITTFCAPPTAYRMMVLQDLTKYDLSNLRYCCGAGEPLNPEVMEVWKRGTELDIYDFYGQTEGVCVVSNYRCMPIKPGSMGKPTPIFDVSLVDDNGNEIPTGEEGHVAIRVKPDYPYGLFKEYWKEPEEMAEVFRGDWYYTGDKAYTDDEGYFWFVGRADDVIISGGYRIGPFEVESALVEHSAVAESAVVSSPDKIRGEIVKAFVVLAPGYQPSDQLTKELQDHVKNVTAPYKYPRDIKYVTELPKTISGKIRRVELRKAEWENKGRGSN